MTDDRPIPSARRPVDMDGFRQCLTRMVRHGETLNAAADMIGFDPLDAQSFIDGAQAKKLYADALESAMDYWTSQMHLIDRAIQADKEMKDRDVKAYRLRLVVARQTHEQFRNQRRALKIKDDVTDESTAQERIMTRLGITIEDHN